MANKSKKHHPVLEVCVDTQIINTPGVGASVLQACESVGVRCVARDQLMTGIVTWWLLYESETHTRHLSKLIKANIFHCIPQLYTEVCQDMKLSSSTGSMQETSRMEEMDEVLAVISVDKFVAMVYSQVKKTGGESHNHTLTQYIRQLQHIFPGKHLMIAVHGMDKYFSDQKLEAKRRHRQEVTSQKARGNQKVPHGGGVMPSVTRFQLEETVVIAQLETGCCCRLADWAQDIADLIKCFSKAVMDKPSKKDRFDGVFSFLEEGGSGVKADKTGAGLLKVWKLQLQQLHNLGPDIAAAIISQFPSPQALYQAYMEYPNPAEAWRVTENIVVRRGGGALETSRKVGQQLSKKIYTLMTATDQDIIIK